MKTKQMINDLVTTIIAARAGCLANVEGAIMDALETNCTPAELAAVRAQLAPAKRRSRVQKTAVETARTPAAMPSVANLPKHASTPGTVEFEAIVGPYGTEFEAKQEVTQFQHPNVFAYRPAVFPTPQNYGVETRVLEASVVQIKNPNPLYPYGVKLQVAVTGKRAQEWISAFKNRARLFNVA